jgi:hypothetical protein
MANQLRVLEAERSIHHWRSRGSGWPAREISVRTR